MEIKTERLRLVACTIELATAERQDATSLGKLLNCATPDDWPPPLNDEDSAQFFLSFARDHPDAIGWGLWYFIAGRELVGNGGFKGMPSAGEVEIGYSIVPRHQRRGFASEATRGLIEWAFEHDDVERVIAHTLPELIPSIGVLNKLGFESAGEGEEPGSIRFELPREDWRTRRGAAASK